MRVVITPWLVTFSFLFYRNHAALVSDDDRAAMFLGCAPITDCKMEEFFLGAKPAQIMNEGETRYDPTDCINYCLNSAPGAPMHSFAGVAYKTCYCFNSVKHLEFLNSRDKRCKEECPPGASCASRSLLYIYSVCPHGFTGPPSCSVKCPDHCVGRYMIKGHKFDEGPYCYGDGECIFGCRDDYCRSLETCETVTSAGLTVAKDASKRSSLADMTPAGLYIFKTLCFSANGYVNAAEYYGKAHGAAYVGVWRNSPPETLFRVRRQANTDGGTSAGSTDAGTTGATSDAATTGGATTDAGTTGVATTQGGTTAEATTGAATTQGATTAEATTAEDEEEGERVFGPSWTLVWKHKLVSGSNGFHTEHFKPDTDDTFEVMKDDCLGVHFDLNMVQMDVGLAAANNPDYTMLYATNDVAEGAGSYAFVADMNGFDDNWSTEESERRTMAVPDVEGAYAPTVALSISCQCPEGCHLGVCRMDGSCSKGCIPGLKGDSCNENCTINEYGPSCSESCPPGCKTDEDMANDNSTEIAEDADPTSPCDAKTGVCVSGCKPGFQGIMCDIPCDDGKWGDKCKQQCAACNNKVCDKVTGGCGEAGCRPGFMGDKCDEKCTDKRWGESCKEKCGMCYGGEDCDPETGACEGGCDGNFMLPTCRCANKTYGTNCTEPCGHCSDNAACRDDNGECEYGCIDGYQPPQCINGCNKGYWGPNCGTACGHCANDEDCNDLTGKCTACAPGYLGDHCMQTCPQGTWGDGCTNKCNYCDYSQGNEGCQSSDGSCKYGCQGGFKLPKCDTCKDGYYGPACLKCGKCKDGKECDDNGECPDGCAPGVYSTAGCNEPCKPGTWGDNCQETCGHCVRCTHCRATDGACEKGCTPGYTAPLCKEMCPSQKYGGDCGKSCGFCAEDSCNPRGLCMKGCDGDYIPPTCELQSCPPGVWGSRCSKICGKCKGGVSCHKIDASCPEGCAEGYTGEFCTQKKVLSLRDDEAALKQCDPFFWGTDCDKPCGKCEGGASCDTETGNCDSCELGFNPPLCVDPCPKGKWGIRCLIDCGECLEDLVCKNTDGACPKGCKDGYHRPSCISPCDDGWYGPECKKQCGHCRGGCRFSDGFCTTGCDPGWEGDMCSVKVRGAEDGDGEEEGETGGTIICRINVVVAFMACVLSQILYYGV